MATHQPNMDALNKIAKKRKAETPTTNPEMTKRISSLYKRSVEQVNGVYLCTPHLSKTYYAITL